MPGLISQPKWPEGWPSFTPKDCNPKDTVSSDLKKAIIAEYGAEALRQAWIKTCNALSSVTSRIAATGVDSVPVFEYDEIISSGYKSNFDNEQALKRIRAVGCCIIRGVIPQEEATQHLEDLQTFIAQNADTITGWPKQTPAIFHLYESPVQLKLRTHPNQLQLQRLLNSLFTDPTISPEEEKAQCEPILYPDALRVRQPGQDFDGLGPHIDGGSLSRWADDEYRHTYHKILSGHPEEYDPYDLSHRRVAKPSMFPGGAMCTVLRNFQGWTALTECSPGEGGLMVMPDIHLATAYMILRPFFKDPRHKDTDQGNDWKDPEKWELDDSSWFPGTYPMDAQLLSPASHPHLHLEDTLVSVPTVYPGDTIWWHADELLVDKSLIVDLQMCHAVETTHNGTRPAAVVYIPAAPSTPDNKEYIRRHWRDLLAGNPPDDYKYLDGTGTELVLSKQNERNMIGALPIDTISAEGRRALGEGV
ncbi:hypothetical protein A1O3_06882 [Capronia epimyces CBS 606.96]|uniref:Uncharacterized protein n=1 Tax=Capronia epimyces CBS 606.96 TaxID=1182542 RepID=W9YE61_9EURO|nr:uncharacterized protein A1O3_06882 [Capronia epimyces CBS 606.96]EXJ80599.1 hypothetical protein A1O3_06882 [Capronia epimyces CBS 606.96]